MVARICILVALPFLLVGASAASSKGGSAPPPAPGAAAASAPGIRPEIIVQSLTVTGSAYPQLAGRFNVDSDRLHSNDPAMTVTVQVRAMAEYLIAANIVLEAAQDDTGASLLAGSQVQKPRAMIWEPSAISADHHSSILEITFSRPPSAEAKELTLRGFARLQVGRRKQSLHATVPLLPATVFGPPALPLRITAIGGDDRSVNLQLEGPAALDRITNITFSDDRGRLLATRPVRIEGASVINQQASRIHYDLPASPDSVQVDVSWYESTQDVNVPFELKLGAGFEGK